MGNAQGNNAIEDEREMVYPLRIGTSRTWAPRCVLCGQSFYSEPIDLPPGERGLCPQCLSGARSFGHSLTDDAITQARKQKPV